MKKKLKKIKIYNLIFLIISLMFIYNAYYFKSKEINFNTKEINFKNKTIKNENGKIYTFHDSLKIPKYIYDYVGYIKNNKIVSYRRKINGVGEFMYMFGPHQKYSKYRTSLEEKEIKRSPKQMTETLDVKMMHHDLTNNFIVIWILYGLSFIISTLIFIFNWDNTDYVKKDWWIILGLSLNHYITIILMSMWVLNFMWWLILFILIMAFIYIYGIFNNYLFVIRYYIKIKETQSKLKKQYLNNYNKLLNL